MNSERYINRSMSIISSDWLCSWCGQLEFSKSGWLHYGQIEHEIERECFGLRHVTLVEEHVRQEWHQTR